MAITSVSNNYAESWTTVYQAFQQINFSAWDYNTIKQSLVDYLKLYHSEDFNDFIETAELVMIIELFSYVGELMAYRFDLNAHENFITVANRKESVLRLAKALAYNASRNIPARGLVKITSISTTETVYDANGNNLANVIIYWNDPNNSNWKDQFILVINKILAQSFGTVLPSDRIQVQDVLFELYAMNNQPLQTQTIPYNITVSGQQYPMELVSADLNTFGPLEHRPQLSQVINILYLNDGLGDSSDNTGFFFFTKQGSLQRTLVTFDGVTPNQTFDVTITNSNDIDVWLNNIDPTTGQILTGTDVRETVPLGEWQQVDVTSGQNVLFNTNSNMNKYEIETLVNDQFRLIFGDGNFANIPSGLFEVWSRTSANVDLVIPISAIQNLNSSVFYLDSQLKQQTFSFSFSLTDTIQNAATTEDINHIRLVAPAVYVTQDRMVNNRDYNEFPLQDNSILKLQAINRTFAGDSRYIPWHDPTGNYENVKMFGSDLAIYFKSVDYLLTINNSSLPATDGGANIARINAVINNYIQPLLSNDIIVMREILAGVNPANVRKIFTNSEVLNIQAALTNAINSAPSLFFITYVENIDTWQVSTTQPASPWIVVTGYDNGDFAINYYGNYIVAHSDNMKFWVTNNSSKVLNYDTLSNDVDTITLLQANIGTAGILTQNYVFDILQQDIIDSGPNSGLSSDNDLIIIPADTNNDGLPDNVSLSYLINPSTDFVYFNRSLGDSGGYTQWALMPATSDNIAAYQNDVSTGAGLWKREIGKYNLNYMWLHITPNYHLVDPCPSNIIDTYIITRGYYTNLISWLNGLVDVEPQLPTPFELRNDYGYLLDNGMMSDANVLQTGKFKLIIGAHADLAVRATLNVVQKPTSTMTPNQIKLSIVNAVNKFFDITYWDFGQPFYFQQLSAFIVNSLPADITSVVLVPLSQANIFGDLFQILAKEGEIIKASISVNDIVIVESLDPRTYRNSSI